jgi:hypothetical protein
MTIIHFPDRPLRVAGVSTVAQIGCAVGLATLAGSARPHWPNLPCDEFMVGEDCPAARDLLVLPWVENVNCLRLADPDLKKLSSRDYRFRQTV